MALLLLSWQSGMVVGQTAFCSSSLVILVVLAAPVSVDTLVNGNDRFEIRSASFGVGYRKFGEAESNPDLTPHRYAVGFL